MTEPPTSIYLRLSRELQDFELLLLISLLSMGHSAHIVLLVDHVTMSEMSALLLGLQAELNHPLVTAEVQPVDRAELARSFLILTSPMSERSLIERAVALGTQVILSAEPPDDLKPLEASYRVTESHMIPEVLAQALNAKPQPVEARASGERPVIHFINHASFMISYQGLKLITDPWLEGDAFDQGWSLIAKTQFSFDDFADVTHIWFSHEHPDHFSPANLSKIPPEHRAKITILYQKTKDMKVHKFCSAKGFKEVISLEHGVTHQLASGFDVLCQPFTYGDSYALFTVDQYKILNLNDCMVFNEEAALQVRAVTGTVDCLFTQFNYANKVGNTDEVGLRQKLALQKLERIKHQRHILKPKLIIPFASYVFFSHEENAYMNQGMNTIQRAHQYITEELQERCVVLYPGDTMSIDASAERQRALTSSALERYAVDYQRIEQLPLTQAPKVNMLELIQSSRSFMKALIEDNPKIATQLARYQTAIYITDYQQSFIINGKNGLVKHKHPRQSCDIEVGSQALKYCFDFKWGGDTLNVNARFQSTPNGDYQRFRKLAMIASLNNQGQSVS